MNTGTYKIIEHQPLAADVYRLRLAGDTSAIQQSGEFVELRIPHKYLRRPISVSDYDEESLTLVYKILGEGTRLLSSLAIGESVDLLTGLGKGFSERKDPHPLLIGGGVGVPPLLLLAKRLVRLGASPTVLLGFNRGADVFYTDELRQLPRTTVHVATMDGSKGSAGTVIDLYEQLSPRADYLYACGPMGMLKAVHGLPIDGEFSLEERMGCGFGACMGCSIMTASGAQRVCKEGPVFDKKELLW